MTDTGELDAVIIRNITEIEQGYDRIHGEIEKRLDAECGKIFEEAARKYGWISKATSIEEDFWMTKSQWQLEEGPAEESDHYLSIAIDNSSNGPDVSWAQTFVGGQGAQLLITIVSDLFTSAKWFRFLKDGQANKLVREIVAASTITFDPDNKYEPFARPVKIDQEELARAFAGEIEFEDALMPLEKALHEVLELEEMLGKMVKLIRKAQV